MLSHDLQSAAEAARLSAEAPAADLRQCLLRFSILLERAAQEAMVLERGNPVNSTRKRTADALIGVCQFAIRAGHAALRASL